MADYTTVMTGTAQVDDSIIELMDRAFYIANGENGITDQFVTYKQNIGAKSIDFTRYERLAPNTTPLNEREEIASSALTDSKVTLTPAEYGDVVTKTNLASLQTGGKVDRAASQIVGIHAGESTDKLAILAGEATTNVVFASGTDEASTVAGDVMSVTILNQVYNRLSRANVPKLQGGFYIAQMHDDVIHDLRADASAGSWLDINKYSNPEDVLRNEIGTLNGFRIIRNNNQTINADGGAGTVDTYSSLFMGFNALGKAESQAMTQKITGPFDKLGRFVNIGWYWVGQYKVIDVDAIWKVISASSVGDNA